MTDRNKPGMAFWATVVVVVRLAAYHDIRLAGFAAPMPRRENVSSREHVTGDEPPESGLSIVG